MADISKVQLPDGTEYNFKDDTSGYIKSPNLPYFTCATGAGTAAKVATLVKGSFTTADLVTGAQILVKFTNSNTVASPTLNANSTGAKSIKRYGTTAPSTSAATSWNAGNVFLFVYDGSYWQMAAWINTTYSSMSTTEIAAGTGTSSRVITPTNLKLAIQTWAQVKSVNGQTGAVVLDAADVGALPDDTVIPSAISDLSNDMVYDLGLVQPATTGAFVLTDEQAEAILAMWDKGLCAVTFMDTSFRYWAIKQDLMPMNGIIFKVFTGAWGAVVNSEPKAGTVALGISSQKISGISDAGDVYLGMCLFREEIDTNMIGAVNGVAPLDASGKIDSSYLPPGSASVSDVRVNNTSVVSNDVANIPLASTTKTGVVSTVMQSFTGEKTFHDQVNVIGNAAVRMSSGTETDAVGYQVEDFNGSIAGDMIMSVTTIDGDKYPRRFRFRQYGLVPDTCERQSYCETYSLPAGPLNLSDNANYEIVTTKPVTPNATYAANVLGNLGIHKFSMSAAKAVTVPADYRGVLYVTDNAGGNCGEYFIISSSTSATGYTGVKTASNFTLTNGTGSITLTPASGTRYCMLLDINGFATV